MNAPTRTGYIEFPEGDLRRVYVDPIETIEAHRVEDVLPALLQIESRVADGFHAAGYVAYEAAPAFDPAFQTHPTAAVPLLYFGIYAGWRQERATDDGDFPPMENPTWVPAVERPAYDDAFAAIRAHIGAGDSYQVNYTFPTSAEFHVDGLAWFRDRQRAQASAYSAYLNLGSHEIISLSPELFFSLDGDQLESRPMKGTRPRGFSPDHDRLLAEELRHSPKEQAENLMIVDMLRNDMGRICANNSIDVPALFSIEQYPTVWQMTSTVTGRTDAGVPELFRALFPCASVTGAPKIETMKIIRQLESVPRGVYCGAIGWWGPERQARFNVAIRTATLDKGTARAQYPVGSGITWDSVNSQEYAECNTKTTVLQHSLPPFELLSSLRLDEEGYFLLPWHLERLARSASHFVFPFDRQAVESALENYRKDVGVIPAKVRICIDQKGRSEISHRALPEPEAWNVGLAGTPIDICQSWVYHKTTHRNCYDSARATRPDCTDVILYNRDGYLTEATYANIVLEIGGVMYTPPLKDGLLDGVFRRHLLSEGLIEERSLTRDDLARAERIFLINSVRKWIAVNWMGAVDEAPLVEHTR